MKPDYVAFCLLALVLIPFLVPAWLCFRAGWRAYRDELAREEARVQEAERRRQRATRGEVRITWGE